MKTTPTWKRKNRFIHLTTRFFDFGQRLFQGIAVKNQQRTAFANVLFYGLMKRTDPTVSLSVTYLVPCFGMLWGWLFLDETVAVLQMLGFGVIVASLFMVASHARSKPAAARL